MKLYMKLYIITIGFCITALAVGALVIRVRHDYEIEQQRKADITGQQFFHYEKQPMGNQGFAVK